VRNATVHKCYQVLTKILAAAVEGGMIPRSPCRQIPLPKIERAEMRFLTVAEVHRTRVWRPATRAAGLEGYESMISGIRRSPCGSRPGAGPNEIATRAGHMSVSFALDRYGHLYLEADRALRDRLDRFHEAADDAE
jgi:hypothetical protein